MSAITWTIEPGMSLPILKRLWWSPWRKLLVGRRQQYVARIADDGIVIARETFGAVPEAQAWLKAELVRMRALSPPPAAATPHGPEISSWLADELKK